MGYPSVWTEAGRDVEAEQRARALDHARAAVAEIWPFVAQAKSRAEYGHRKALVEERLSAIAAKTQTTVDDVSGILDRFYATLKRAEHEPEEGELPAGPPPQIPGDEHSQLNAADDAQPPIDNPTEEPIAPRPWYASLQQMKRALQEGQDPLAWETGVAGQGGGPEKPDEHDEGPDFSHGYSEIPQGQPGGNDVPPYQPNVPAETGLASEESPRPKLSAVDATTQVTDPGPSTNRPTDQPEPDQGFPQFQDTPVVPLTTKPAQTPGGGPSGMTTDPTMMPGAGAPDPIAEQVNRAAALVQQYNPHLDADTCRHVARKAVGRYLVTAEAGDSAFNNMPEQPEEDEDGNGEGGGHGVADYMVGRGLMKVVPEIAAAL